MDHQLSRLSSEPLDLVATARARGRWLQSSRAAARLLVRALLRLAMRIVRAVPVSELSYVLAADAVWLLGADSTTMLHVEGDLRPGCSRELARDWDIPMYGAAPGAARTTAMPFVEPPDLAAAIGRLVYPGRPGAIVRFEAQMLGTGLMAAYPWSAEHGWTVRN
jgi:hypothetical protein